MNWFAEWMCVVWGLQPVRPVVKPAEISAADAYQLGYANGMQAGLAQGELKGRTELALELEVQYGVDAREELSAEVVKRIRVRQVH